MPQVYKLEDARRPFAKIVKNREERTTLDEEFAELMNQCKGAQYLGMSLPDQLRERMSQRKRP